MTQRPKTRRLRVRREGNGFAVEGRGFYVWDEDPEEVLKAARELLSGGHPRVPPRRMLLLRSAETAKADAEALDA